MTYTLNAPSNPILIQNYAEENIKPVLGQLAGVYKVELNGATPMEWQLEYDSEQLSRLGITLGDVQVAINRHYEKEFLGICSIEKGPDDKDWIRVVRTATGKETEFEPDAIKLETGDGTVVTLDKLIKVKHVEEQPQSYYRINGLNSIYLYITAEETANQLELSRQVKDRMAELQAKMPAGYEVHIGYDATEYIQKELIKFISYRTDCADFIAVCCIDYPQFALSVSDSNQLDYQHSRSCYFLLYLRTGNAALFFGRYYHFSQLGDRQYYCHDRSYFAS